MSRFKFVGMLLRLGSSLSPEMFSFPKAQWMKAEKNGAGTAPIASAMPRRTALSVTPNTTAKCLMTAANTMAVISQTLK